MKLKLICLLGALLTLTAYATPWYQQESDNFIIIYKRSHAYLVPHVIEVAEKSLSKIQEVVDYHPSEKIIINLYDFTDYGNAGATTIPQNFIRLQIEPLEMAYESMLFNERFQWLISHELIHIVVNDQQSKTERFFRPLFSKVPPESKHPFTIFYSLFTNQSRFSPRWHHEGIAVFWETWLNGGFGRLLGNFDEMYFRSKIFEDGHLPTEQNLDSKISYQSFLVETLFYLYGARFCGYLAYQYGYEKLLDWYHVSDSDLYIDFQRKFRDVFGISMTQAWEEFSQHEADFQQQNIRRLQAAPLTPLHYLHDKPLGWVTNAYLEKSGTSVLFAHHQSHDLNKFVRLNLNDGGIKKLATLPSPSILQISSTAFDSELQLFFYTGNNNQLYRDIYVKSMVSGKEKILFQDVRVGQLTVSPKTHELWGIRHHQGKASLIYSPYPYAKILPVVEFEVGDNLQYLSISPSGDQLAAILHQSDGRQALIVADVQRLREGKNFAFQVVSEEGSPESPSWSPDEQFLFWNAYVNGVSNIYRQNRSTSRIEAVSHTIRGLFKPLYISPDSLFAFEFTSEGFLPVLIPNQPAAHLPAIEYFGQEVLAKNPVLTDWAMPSYKPKLANDVKPYLTEVYKGSKNLHFQSHVPIVTGFQSQVAVGLFVHLTDPLYIHDITSEIAFTPKREFDAQPNLHFKLAYSYRQRISFGIEHNAPDFYDLFNDRKRGFIGNKVNLGYSKYWLYDSPHKIKYTADISYYSNIEAINDNLVRVARPDFMILQNIVTSTNMRKSIGSVDYESGTEWSITGMYFGIDPRNDLTWVGGLHADAGVYKPWGFAHNILHLKIAAGLRHVEPGLANGRFYIGGFGNRGLDTEPVKQYRKPLRFPGRPIYSIVGSRFLKGMIEQTLPPLRFGNLGIGQHRLHHIDISVYSQALWIDSAESEKWIDIGGQINFSFKHWFKLESTFSAGFARAWWENGGNNSEWFVSFKLLK